jgi:protocatechuate 3,4-dioxygenase beta subunit
MSFTWAVLMTLSLTQAAAGAGRLSGRVTTDANVPIADARVFLVRVARQISSAPGMPPQALTGADGRFAFDNLTPGEYRINVQKAGFAPLTDPARLPPVFRVAAGQSLDNLDFRLQKGGVIAGRVLDSNGEPLADIGVIAMRRAPAGQTNRVLIPAQPQQMQQTNDLGEFRLAGLFAGEYFVAAVPRGMLPFRGAGASPAPVSTATTAATTTFYPGTTDQSVAQGITVTAGAEVANIVFAVQKAPVFNVSGVVVDENGHPVAHAVVRLMGDGTNGVFGGPGGGQSQNDGRFVIGEVPSGTYRISASVPIVMGGGTKTPRTGSGRGMESGAYVTFDSGVGSVSQPAEVNVPDADVTDVRVVVRRPPPQ